MNKELMLVLIVAVLVLLFFVMILIFNKISNSYIKKHAQEIIDNSRPISSNFNDIASRLINNKKEYKKILSDLSLDGTMHCSRNIVSNAENNKIKYLIKYSDIEYNRESLEKVEFCNNYLTDLNELSSMYDDVLKAEKNVLPIFIKLFSTKETIPYVVANAIELYHFKKAFFTFSYVSPAGNSEKKIRININANVTSQIASEISGKLSKSEYTKTQRNAMTKDLREAIKKRDNYTCCICGNSVYDEPNLLLEVDHIIPVAKGGKTQADNLQTLCWRCNRDKGQEL